MLIKIKAKNKSNPKKKLITFWLKMFLFIFSIPFGLIFQHTQHMSHIQLQL